MTLLDLTQAPARLDGWTIHLGTLHGMGEVFDKPTRTAIIDPTMAGPKLSMAHGLAHIRLKHMYDCPSGVYTDEQCDAADVHAQDMLAASIEWARSPEPVGMVEWPEPDGDPTIPKVDLV